MPDATPLWMQGEKEAMTSITSCLGARMSEADHPLPHTVLGGQWASVLGGQWASVLGGQWASVLGGQWTLYSSGEQTSPTLASVMLSITTQSTDSDQLVVGQVVGILETLDHQYVMDADRRAFRRFVCESLLPHMDLLSVQQPSKTEDSLMRVHILRAAALVCRLPEVVADASRRLEQYLDASLGDSRTAAAPILDINALDVLSLIGARSATASGVLYDKIRQCALSSAAEPGNRRRMLMALTAVEEPALVTRSIESIVSSDVPLPDTSPYIAGLLSNRVARDMAFDFVKANWLAVRAKTQSSSCTEHLIEALGQLYYRRLDVEAWLTQQADSLATAPLAVKQIIERMRMDEALASRVIPDLHQWMSDVQLLTAD